jgi:hypothetical protein
VTRDPLVVSSDFNRGMRRLVALVGATLVLAAASCGGSGTPKSTEAFCTRLADLRDRNPITDAATDSQAADEVAGILDDLIETAPQQIKGDLRRFRALVDDVRTIDTSDPAAAEDAVRALATPEVIQSAQSLAEFAQQECGLSDVFTPDAAGDGS